MAQNKIQKDPVEETKKKLDIEKAEKEVQAPDESILEFKTISPAAARGGHPFDGYPYAPKIELVTINHKGEEVGKKTNVSATFIVSVHPSFVPNQDVSGLRVQIQDHKMKSVTTPSGTHKVMKPDGEMSVVDLTSPHSRVIKCYEPPYNGDNYDVVFDRKLKLPSGAERLVAIVPQHSIRAQLMYVMNWKDDPPTVSVDKRYEWLDTNQRKPLRRLFDNVMRRNLSRERMAQMVSGEMEASEADLMKVQTEV